jgi:DNA-binding NarL/FixJ family response regulator
LLLADDHPVVLAGLREMLEPYFEIAGAATDGRTLIRLASDLKPDVVLLDISMPQLNGLTAAREIKKAMPQVKLIFLTMHADTEYVKEARRAGASGYILKKSAASELINGIREVLKGRTYIAPEIAGGLTDAAADGSAANGELTSRQREVLQLLAEGHPCKEIAARLHVSVKTVEFHKAVIKRKLKLRSMADLIKYAIKHKIAAT